MDGPKAEFLSLIFDQSRFVQDSQYLLVLWYSGPCYNHILYSDIGTVKYLTLGM